MRYFGGRPSLEKEKYPFEHIRFHNFIYDSHKVCVLKRTENMRDSGKQQRKVAAFCDYALICQKTFFVKLFNDKFFGKLLYIFHKDKKI